MRPLDEESPRLAPGCREPRLNETGNNSSRCAGFRGGNYVDIAGVTGSIPVAPTA